MNQQKLSSWLKAIIIIIGLCGLIVYFGILPDCGSWMQDSYPEFDQWFENEVRALLQGIAWLVAGDILFFFLGNVVFFFMSMNHPGIFLISLLICFVGFSVTVAAACLSHLVRKAADLQEQSDLTV